MLFASLIIDREPLQWSSLPVAFLLWLQNAGGVAAVAIALILLARSLSRDPNEWASWNFSASLRPLATVLRFCIVASGLGYAILILLWLGWMIGIQGVGVVIFNVGRWLLTISGALALCVALAPVLADLALRISPGRIWAIARLSWKEAVRGRVIWVFGSMALVFLFADWFVGAKAEDQVRNYVRVVYWSMTPLFLITAGLLGSFSIPNDVRNNSIHTIVTKPVEKFEIVLGRFLGYAGLLSVGLFVVSCVSLIYVVRGVNEEASRESYKARVPVYGKLHFAGTKGAQEAQSVGREWGYRQYIHGPTRRAKRTDFRQYAIWDFAAIPADLGQRVEPSLFEFSFDIFRLSKGDEEGKGVFCTFTFTDGLRDANQLDIVINKMGDERKELENQATKNREKGRQQARSAADQQEVEKQYNQDLANIDQKLMRKHRIYQAKGVEVTDYHTQEVEVPPEFFKVLAENEQPKIDDANVPAMRVFVSADMAREAQMLGMARYDFYLVAHERPFWQNFLKGVLGMWCTHMLVLGIAIACSTYLSAIISLLCTMFLFIAGLFVEYLKEIAENRLDGGGPGESLVRITKGLPVAAKLEPSPTTSLIQSVDALHSWWIRLVMNLIPDVNRYDLHQYVANGFDISWLDLLLLDNILPLLGYLVPWLVLAYYLMKYREIANPM